MNSGFDETYMRRALQLARNGEGRVSPNPMVGAVIVWKDKIIGEGYHANFGEGHAEVNAIRSVKEEDRKLLKESTIYVTLEPCAHYGKTPPCALLIADTGIPKVVIGSLDPNPLVAGKGVKILEEAGIEVTSGVLENECKDLNRKFMKAQVEDRPYIILKWAQSADGFLASIDDNGNSCGVKFSTPLSSLWMHRERASSDAIMVGGNTDRLEHPRLDTRLWGGKSPKRYVAHYDNDLATEIKELRKEGITSLMVEGGAKLLEWFICQGFYDELRIETSPTQIGNGLKAPCLPKDVYLVDTQFCEGNIIQVFKS